MIGIVIPLKTILQSTNITINRSLGKEKFFLQRWSTIPPITTKQTTTSHLEPLSIKIHHKHMALEIQVLALDRHKNVAGLNRLMGSEPSPSDNWITNDNTDINKQYKYFTDSIPLLLFRLARFIIYLKLLL